MATPPDNTPSDGHPATHRGFWARYRTSFHALGYLAALAVAAPRWPYLLAGLPLLALGLAIRTWALGYLHKDEALCTAGPYAYVRNPLYLGSLLILAGLCVASNNVYLTVVSAAGAALIYLFTMRSEESFLATRFGAAYQGYCAQVPRLLPLPGRRAEGVGEQRFSWQRALGNNAAELAGWVLLLVALLAAKSLLGAALGWWPYEGAEPPPVTWGLWGGGR